ncbi:MAG: T9SS C-terminal target domain-containing protein [Verrucomicrobiota bacterium]
MIPKLFLCPVVVLVSILPGQAQELKVDFNASGRPLSETWDTSYIPWSTNQSWFSSTNLITATFNGVTFTFRQAGPMGTGLTTDRYAAGLTTAGWTTKLVNDGITIAPLHLNNTAGSGTPGVRIELTISNLPAGPHSLLAWHNTWQNPANYTFSPLHIYLNGVQIITNLPASNRVTNNADAAYSYVEFFSDGVNNTVIAYEASTDFTVTDAQPCIDGFELDTPNFKFKANKPAPANGDEHVDADATKSVLLYWTKAAIAVSNCVFFGTGSNEVKNATTASPEFKGTQITTNLLVTNLSSLLTYYWRVDQVDSNNIVTKGDLWTFRTRHLAFPGAEGYGQFARGGRGGVVVKVTNLNNSGPGSFRDAIEGDYGPRTVIFDVGGLITLEDDIIVGSTRPYITIAGQTAPGKGICVKKQQFGMSGARDVICRFIRIFVGKESGDTQNATGMSGVDHCIMDHCSFGWGIDEAFSSRTAKNITLQRCFISEMLNIAGHKNYDPGTEHGYAASIGGEIATFHHNLLAHNEGRNWSLAGGLDANGNFSGSMDIFNNVVYNWGGRTTDGGTHRCNFVNNYYKPGAGTTHFKILTANYDNFPGTQQYYFVGNVMPGYYQTNQQASARDSNGYTPTNYSTWVNAPFFPSYATIDEVTNAYKRVLSDVGCNQPMVDDHDSRIIRETITGTYTYTGTGPYGGRKGMPNTTDDVGGWEDYGNHTRPANWDTDNDGMPNWWEQINGSNPNIANHNGDPDGDEYTNLEDYLNWLALPHFDAPNGTPIDIDLTQFTRGFTNNSPVYFISAPTNGTVTLVGNNRIARFTSTVSTNALGSFRFSVVDAQGYNLTNTINLRFITAAAPAQPPVLGIRNQSGLLQIELTGETSRPLTVQSKTNQSDAWLDWTNVTGSGALQLLPLHGLTNQSPRYFRAFAQ